MLHGKYARCLYRSQGLCDESLGISALLVAAGAIGATGTFAWYTSTTSVAVSTSGNVPGTISTTESDLTVGNSFTVKITVSGPASAVELSHYDSTSKHLYRVGHYAASDDRTQVIANDTDTQKCVKAFTVSASWVGGEPTAAADIDYLDGKKATITLDDAGLAQLCTNNTYDADESSSSNGAISATFDLKFDEDDGAIVLSCGTITNGFVRVEPAILDGSRADQSSDHTSDAITVTTTTLSLEDQ